MRARTLSLISSILFIGTASAFAAKSTSVNVTTIVHDTDSAGAQVLIRSDDYNGSGQATYSPSVVSSYILSDGYGKGVGEYYVDAIHQGNIVVGVEVEGDESDARLAQAERILVDDGAVLPPPQKKQKPRRSGSKPN